jgi:hypothetical protein
VREVNLFDCRRQVTDQQGESQPEASEEKPLVSWGYAMTWGLVRHQGLEPRTR